MNTNLKTQNDILLQVKNLKKYFPIRNGLFSKVTGNVKAVDDVSFDIYRGETLGIVGESGCGKTTVGRTLLRLLEPTAGSIFYEGENISKYTRSQLRPLRPKMQIIFQDPYSSLNPRMTVGSMLSEAIRVHDIVPNNEVEKEAINDTNNNRGLRKVVENAGLSWQEAKKRIGDPQGEKMLERNRLALLDAGIWGTPSFRLLDSNGAQILALWGQDRLWRVADEIQQQLTKMI